MAAEKPAPYSGGLKVIGTGLGRTGTSSLKLALERLYGAPCYHMTEVISKGGPFGWFPLWTRMGKGEVSVDELRAHFAPYAATTDYPACLFWKELLEAFPDAKLVHSTRSADSWATSVLETIFTLQPDNPDCPIGTRLLHKLFPFKVGRPFAAMTGSVIAAHTRSDYSHAGLQKTFKEWEASVLAAAPKGRVLVFEAKQGWEPLCKFLGVPVPAEPFPRVNDTAEMKRITFAINTVGWIVAAMYAATAAWLAGKLVPALRR